MTQYYKACTTKEVRKLFSRLSQSFVTEPIGHRSRTEMSTAAAFWLYSIGQWQYTVFAYY
jgi:hypothetical protein